MNKQSTSQLKSILIIGGDSSVKHDIDDIKLNNEIIQAALTSQDLHAEVDMCPIDKIVFCFDTEYFQAKNGQTNTALESYDLVIFKGVIRRSYVAQVATRYLKLHNIHYINGYEQFRAPNKLVQLADMYELGLAMPRTVFCENRLLLAEQSAEYLKLPMITKVVNSSGGRGIYKVDTDKDLKSTLLGYGENNMVLVQQFIENIGDLRILLIGDQELIIYRQAKDGHYINNINQGGKAELVDRSDLPEQLLADARRLQKQQGLAIAGVDVMQRQGTGDFYFLEINTEPSLGSIYRSEKANALGKLIKERLA